MVLVGEHRVVRQAELLGAFDLRVPVRAFDQAAHQAHLVFARQRGNVRHQLQRPALVGLQRQAQAAPLRVVLGHARYQHLQHFER